jgi:glycerol-3-phosphate dehydrogenase
MLTRAAVDEFLDERWPCTLDDVRRGTRLGMGPCQGGYCTFRAAGLVAERAAGGVAGAPGGARVGADESAASDGVLVDFLAERYKGTRPIAWGRQLQELWLTAGLYSGVLGIGSLVDADRDGGAGMKRIAARERDRGAG